MKLWRICKREHESAAFTGLGAQQTGGRWNHKGHAVVYASENLSLAALELFVHLAPHCLPDDLISLCAQLPESVSQTELTTAGLPSNWRSYPAPDEIKQIGSKWIASRASLILRVPSAINPQESNLLVNPNHPEVSQLGAIQAAPFRFDPRMFGK